MPIISLFLIKVKGFAMHLIPVGVFIRRYAAYLNTRCIALQPANYPVKGSGPVPQRLSCPYRLVGTVKEPGAVSNEE